MTEEDENNDDSFNNLSLFLYTVSKNNKSLRDYFNDIGLQSNGDIVFLEEHEFNEIYTLLNKKQKIDMKRNYLYTIRKILHNPNFNLTTVGGKSKKYRKYSKSRKFRKSKKSKKYKKVI